jgi:RHS repeat-associated protein
MEFESPGLEEPARLTRLFRENHQIRFYYDSGRRLERIVDSAGRTIRVLEEPDGRLLSLTLERDEGEPGLLLVGYKYDGRGNLVAATNGSGHGYTFAYDAQNRLVRRIGRKGSNFRFNYDAEGRCIKAEGDNRLYEVNLEYEIPGRVTKVTRADGGDWSYFFDEAGGLSQILDPLGGIQKFVRNKAGRLTAEVDPNGNAAQIIYDRTGAPVEKITALGYRLSLPEDPNAPDPSGHRVAANPAEYQFGRLLDPKPASLPDVDTAKNLPLPNDVRRLVVTRPVDLQPNENRNGFDVRPLGMKWWPGPERGRVFNELGKLVQQCDDSGRLRHWRYDASGNLAQHTDFDGGKWAYEYGSWHFLLGETNPLGAAVRFSYTPQGEMASCTDAGGTRSEYVYDLKDQLIEVRRHGAVRDKYTRDAAGNLLAKYSGDGRPLLRFEIGPGNLPIKRTLSSGDEHTFEYDKSGRYLIAATKRDTLEFAYDAFGNRSKEKRNGQGVEQRFSGWHILTESVFFSRFAVRHRRQTDGTLVITDPGGKRHRVRVHPNGIVECRYGNGSQETAQYDSLGRCLFKSAGRVAGSVWNRRFYWSGEGELQQMQDSEQGEIRHEYDAAHRLRQRVASGRIEDYEWDPAGNLVHQPGLYEVTLQEGNRLKTVNGLSIEYNDRNHVAVRETLDGPVRYAYDSRDQLVGVHTPQGQWGAEYDALGRRTRKTWAGDTTEFFWNTDQLIAEVAPDGRLRLYIYADPLALTPLLFLDYDSIEAHPESCRRYFLFTDQIGTPSLIEDESGKEVWRSRIEPFGQAQIASGSTIECNLRFPGHYFDAEFSLHYNRFRYYDPALGRYLQSDPWGISGGYNLYAYRSNPLLQVDVRGLGEENATNGKPCKPDQEGNSRTERPANETEVSPVTGEPIKGAATVVEYTVDGKVVARYYLDEQGRTVQAEGLLDPPDSYKKKGVSGIKPQGFEDGQDHRGHLIPERSAANQDSVNVPENVIAEHGTESNLSAKKQWENQAKKTADQNPGTWSVHQPQYDGDNPRPTSVDHSLYDGDKNELGNTRTIPNPNYK